ncbi:MULTISPECIES: thermonuclease family protein [Arsenophonus]|uniref:thermonuclease family protein n=1 Tax=Arsenophonus TaxID=637 RepID=UPI00387A2E15
MTKKGYLLILLLIPSFGFANFSGRVVNVIDGDTVYVLMEGKLVKVRLIGIDAPELGQPFGRRSKQNLLHLTAQKQAEVMTEKQDRFGRWLGTLIIAGKNINTEQVRSGLAWAYRYHGKATNFRFLALEKKARQANIGLWSSKNPIEPWLWRKQKSGKKSD